MLVNCHHDTPGLCEDCAALFALVMADVPHLIDDLDIAIAGDARFVEHGTRKDATPTSAVKGGNPAIAAYQRLAAALRGAEPWFDTHSPEQLAIALARHLAALVDEPDLIKVAREVSSAVSRAHKVIDAPPDLFCYGDCPDCHRAIWQERIRQDDDKTPVVCRFPECGYAQPLDRHQKLQLDASQDRWMTVAELCAAFESAGEVMPRYRIWNWANREGLPKEERPVLKWVGGSLKQVRTVDTFRVGDVMDMMIRDKLRKAS